MSEDHPVHIILFTVNKTAHNTCQKDINQHQRAFKPKEMNNLSEVSGSFKSLRNPSMCTPSKNKSSNAHDSYFHSKMSHNQCHKEINKHHHFSKIKVGHLNELLCSVNTSEIPRQYILNTSNIHYIGMCRMRQFLAILRSFFHSSLLHTFSCHSSPPTILPSSLTFHRTIYFLVYISVLLFPNSYMILFLEFYFLPLSVHAQTNVIYVTLLFLLWWAMKALQNFLQHTANRNKSAIIFF
jgi:hypothetical protein